MIVWAGGEFPDEFWGALGVGDAEELAEPLIDATAAIQQEIEGQVSDHDVSVTVIGHSYGGVVVSLAARSGLPADQLLFVNSAGLGADVTGSPWVDMADHVGEQGYAVPYLDDYSVYAMAAPGDVPSILGPLFNGVSPTAVDGVTLLETGSYADGTEISGTAGHSGVFQRDSTAWQNILAVLTGRPVLVD